MIRVRRWLDSDKVREMCIKYNYYTCGDCRAYDRMLANARDMDADNYQELKQIALDIYEHSTMREMDDYGCDLKDMIEGIMYGLLTECTNMYVELDKSEV